jgi:hypothetical protein
LPRFQDLGCATSVPYTRKARDVLLDNRCPNLFAPSFQHSTLCVRVFNLLRQNRTPRWNAEKVEYGPGGSSAACQRTLLVSGLLVSVSVSAWTVGYCRGSVTTHPELPPLAFQSAISATCGTDKLTLLCPVIISPETYGHVARFFSPNPTRRRPGYRKNNQQRARSQLPLIHCKPGTQTSFHCKMWETLPVSDFPDTT